MINENSRITHNMRGTSPCDGCTERFTACWGNCPKDKRGEYGYNAWTDDMNQVKKNRKEYMENRPDDGRWRERWGIKR
jgi:hypothetical protein